MTFHERSWVGSKEIVTSIFCGNCAIYVFRLDSISANQSHMARNSALKNTRPSRCLEGPLREGGRERNSGQGQGRPPGCCHRHIIWPFWEGPAPQRLREEAAGGCVIWKACVPGAAQSTVLPKCTCTELLQGALQCRRSESHQARARTLAHLQAVVASHPEPLCSQQLGSPKAWTL